MSHTTAAQAETRYVTLEGNQIAYRSIGTGQPMVLVNRMRGTLDTWDPLFLDHLAVHFRVITVDYPGIGYSGGALPADMGQAAAFVVAFATAIGLDRYILLGWSWGGFVAQTALVDHPQRIAKAILVGTNPPGRMEHPIQPAFLERAFKPVNDLADEEVLFFEPRSEASRRAARDSRERIRARPDVDARIPSRPEEIQRYVDALATYRDDTHNRREALTRTDIPILVICGDNDTSNAAANWYPLIGRMPTAQFLIFPATGHGPQHQHPELSARYIADFVELASA
jgi:pimeloyl-ACP methyl ester carboxylesterase